MMSSVGEIVSVLGTALGVISPPVGAAVSVAGSGATVWSSILDRRRKRQLDRLNEIVTGLSIRMSSVENLQAILTDEQVDLFVEVVEKAVRDDEAGKEKAYQCLLEWILREKPTLAQVRILTEAVRQLSLIELRFFVKTLHGINARNLLIGNLPDTVVYARLESLGLSVGGIKADGSPTILGLVIRKWIRVNDLD